MAPTGRALAGHRHLQLWRERWCHYCPGHHSLDHSPFRLACRIPCHRCLRRAVDPMVAQELSQAFGTFHVDARRVAPYLPRSGHTDGTRHSLVEATHLPADLGILHCEVSHRSDLVVLSFLVAVLFRLPFSPWPF